MPLALVDRTRARPRVVAVNAAARARGLGVGADVGEARLRVPDIVLLPDDPPARTRALVRICRGLRRLSPRVVPEPPDGVLLDVTGCAALFGGEAALVRAASDHLRRLDVAVLAGLGDTPEEARLRARFAARAPEDVPAPALAGDPRLVRTLHRLGLRRLSDLAALPRAAVARHLDPALARRLDALAGRREEALAALPEAPRFRVHLVLPAPLREEAALPAVLERGLHRLLAGLERSGRVVRRLRCTLAGGGGSRILDLEPASPAPDASLLLRLLLLRLERRPPPAVVEEVVLEAVRHAPRPARQRALEGGEEEAEAFPRLLEELGALLGPRRVLVFEPRDDHRPLRTVRVREADGVPPAPFPRPPAPRPLLWLPRPRPVEVVAVVPDGPPVALVEPGSGLLRLSRAGPVERIEPAWWRESDPRDVGRDFFAVRDERGRGLWLAREEGPDGAPRWFLLGTFG
ncbi:hypothetical protein HRbin39_00604 [bacterium HR39]|nr:hypothetical protein HRbin39_00604 [bacterium HR39]